MKKSLLSFGAGVILATSAGAAFSASPVAQSAPPAIIESAYTQNVRQVSEALRPHQHGPDENETGDWADDEKFVHPNLGEGEQLFDSVNFRIHYTTVGDAAVSTKDSDKNGTPDYVERVAESLEHARDVTINQFGWAPPPSDGTWGGNALYDVYLENLAEEGLGGYVDGGQDSAIVGDNPNTPNVVEAQSSISYMGLDKAYQEPGVSDAEALTELQTTAVHEYFHSVQFGYDAVEPANWLWEATANWMMEEVYPSINIADDELFNAYDSPDLAQSGEETDWYAQWIFFRYISEQYGHDTVKAIWEAARTQDGYDAIETALRNAGTSLDEVSRGYRLAQLTNSFSEGSAYPTVRLEGAVSGQFQPNDGVENMGADYVEILGTGPVAVTLDATGLEGRVVGIHAGKANVFEMPNGQATVDSAAFDKIYLIVQNLNRLAPETAPTAMTYTVSVTPGSNVGSPILTIDAPNFEAPEVAVRTEYDQWEDGGCDTEDEWGSDYEWADGEEYDGEYEDDGWDATTEIEPPAQLQSSNLPAGYEIVDAFDDGYSLNVVYVSDAADADSDEPYIMITQLTEPVASLEELGIDGTSGEVDGVQVGEMVALGGQPILIEEEDGILYATFVKDGMAYFVDATLSQAELLNLIQELPSF